MVHCTALPLFKNLGLRQGDPIFLCGCCGESWVIYEKRYSFDGFEVAREGLQIALIKCYHLKRQEGRRREGEEIAHFHFVDDTILCLDVYFEVLRVSM